MAIRAIGPKWSRRTWQPAAANSNCTSFLPYAPDLNPDEFVWQYAKTNGVAKKPLRRNESLKERVTEDLAKIKANQHLVRSFFMGQSVVYAKD